MLSTKNITKAEAYDKMEESWPHQALITCEYLQYLSMPKLSDKIFHTNEKECDPIFKYFIKHQTSRKYFHAEEFVDIILNTDYLHVSMAV